MQIFDQKGHFKGSSEKSAHRQKTLGGRDDYSSAPCSGGYVS